MRVPTARRAASVASIQWPGWHSRSSWSPHPTARTDARPRCRPHGPMSGSQERRAAEPPSCPLLGLPDDPVSRFSYPSVAHRCRADNRPRPIDLGHQGAFCLAATYPECPRYQAAPAPGRPGAATPPAPTTPPSPAAAGVALERVAASPSAPAALGGPGTTGHEPSRRIGRWRRVVAIVLAVLLLTSAIYLGSPGIADWMRQVGAGAAAASPSSSTAPPATPAPTLTTPAPTPSAAPSLTPTPAATPLVHVVVRGETLISIAARYGITLVALKKANGITGAGMIRVGQRLVIPPP